MVIFSNLQILTDMGLQKNMSLVVRDKVIESIERVETVLTTQTDPTVEILEFPENYYLVPGFIDMHIHGAAGCDVMDATPTSFTTIRQTLAAEGTTGFLATTMTATPSEIENTLSAIRDYIKIQSTVPGAAILGVHLEGPFLSPNKVGAQRADQIMLPQKSYLEAWQTLSENSIKLVTLAPELSTSLEFIRYLKENNIIASIGHTDATYAESRMAITAGCTYATHLFNAMRGIHQREPGVITAVLLSALVTAELILDGVHLHPAIVELILKVKGAEKLVLVTDAMRAKCLQDGLYDLGGQDVIVENHIARLKDGTLAGSVLKMNSALRNLLAYTDCCFSDAIKMTSENQAKALGIFARKGSIAVGKDADLVVLDNVFNVVMTVCEGKIIYRAA